MEESGPSPYRKLLFVLWFWFSMRFGSWREGFLSGIFLIFIQSVDGNDVLFCDFALAFGTGVVSHFHPLEWEEMRRETT